MNIYYITVTFNGSPLIDNDNSTDNSTGNATAFVPTPINFNITALDWKSNGQLAFTAPVNMSNIITNFDSLFYVYVNSIPMNDTEEILQFNTTWTDGSMLLNFTVEFQHPYLYGLLNKKTDWLVIGVQGGADPSLILFNSTANVIGANTSQIRINMQFDYRSTIIINSYIFVDEKMSFMKNTATYLYYVMIAIIVI